MAFFDTVWYLDDDGTHGYSAVGKWTALTPYAAGAWVRQNAAPSVGSERCFVCIVAGTTLASEPTWTTTRGAKTAEAAGPTWQECTGMAGPNGDLTNAPTWTTVKNAVVTLGEVIYDSGSGSLQICSTGGTSGNGSTPSFSATAGTTTADNTVTWTSLGATSNYTTTKWQYPAARLMNVAATTWMAAGNTLFVASEHSETQTTAITTPSNASTAASPFNIYCVGKTNVPPTNADLTTGATIATSGASAITNSLIAQHYGLTFSSGSAANTANLTMGNVAYSKFDTCTFKLNNTSTTSTIDFTMSGTVNPVLVNCNYIFGATGQTMFNTNTTHAATIVGGVFAPSGSVPTTLLAPANGKQANITIRDADLSAITGTLIALGGWNNGKLKLQNCKLGAGVAMASGSFTGPNEPSIEMANCDSSSTNYRYFYQDYCGSIQQETTIVRIGGASDGVTPLSWNMTSSANTKFPATPLVSQEIAQWNSVTGVAKTATIYVATNTTLNNNDFYAELEYPSSSSTPVGALIDSKMALLGTAAALTTDSNSTWGGSPSNKYKITLNFTPQMKGPCKLRLYLAKPSVSVYVDPYIYIA